jgi:hypothetical protein
VLVHVFVVRWLHVCSDQGVLEMWVDILTPEEAKQYPPVCACVRACTTPTSASHPALCAVLTAQSPPPPSLPPLCTVQVKIAKPPPQEFELRAVIWRCRDVKASDAVRGGPHAAVALSSEKARNTVM